MSDQNLYDFDWLTPHHDLADALDPLGWAIAALIDPPNFYLFEYQPEHIVTILSHEEMHLAIWFCCPSSKWDNIADELEREGYLGPSRFHRRRSKAS